METVDEETIECEAPDCAVEATDDVAGRDAMGVLWIYWVCPDHTVWAHERIEGLA